jgi:hypothetical protein
MSRSSRRDDINADTYIEVLCQLHGGGVQGYDIRSIPHVESLDQFDIDSHEVVD